MGNPIGIEGIEIGAGRKLGGKSREHTRNRLDFMIFGHQSNTTHLANFVLLGGRVSLKCEFDLATSQLPRSGGKPAIRDRQGT